MIRHFINDTSEEPGASDTQDMVHGKGEGTPIPLNIPPSRELPVYTQQATRRGLII